MLRADQAPYFETCPRCRVGGLERLKTHTYCVNCNYEEVGSSEIGAIPQWAIDAIKHADQDRKRKRSELLKASLKQTGVGAEISPTSCESKKLSVKIA